MAHFAKIEDGVVTNVVVVDNKDIGDPDNVRGLEVEPEGIAWCKKLFGEDTEWVQTSCNNNFRKEYAGIGMTYDSVKEKFIQPNTFPSWTLDENDDWKPPVPIPDDYQEVPYVWDEENQKFEPYIKEHVWGSEDEKNWLYTKEQLAPLNKLVDNEGKPVDVDGNIL